VRQRIYENEDEDVLDSELLDSAGGKGRRPQLDEDVSPKGLPLQPKTKSSNPNTCTESSGE